MATPLEGFYAGYFTGIGGNGVAIFVLKDGVLTGADLGAVLFDGTYIAEGDGSYTGKVVVKVPPGTTIVQGVTAPANGLQYEVPIRLPADFTSQPFMEISTPLGPVNVRLQKVRGF